MATQKDIKYLIKSQTFPVEYRRKGEPVTPFMEGYKAKIQSDGILDKLKLKIAVR